MTSGGLASRLCEYLLIRLFSVSWGAPVPSESPFYYSAQKVLVSSTSILTSAVWEFILCFSMLRRSPMLDLNRWGFELNTTVIRSGTERTRRICANQWLWRISQVIPLCNMAVKLVVYFLFACFVFWDTDSLALAILGLIVKTRLALKPQRSACLCRQIARIKGMHHHAQLVNIFDSHFLKGRQRNMFATFKPLNQELACAGFYITLAQSRVIWEDRTSIEKMPPQDWAADKTLRHFLSD